MYKPSTYFVKGIIEGRKDEYVRVFTADINRAVRAAKLCPCGALSGDETRLCPDCFRECFEKAQSYGGTAAEIQERFMLYLELRGSGK